MKRPDQAMARTASACWTVQRRGSCAVVVLTGDWTARETGIQDASAVRLLLSEAGDSTRLAFETSGLGRWDSALIVIVQRLRQEVELDESGLPNAARRLLALAAESETGQESISPAKPTWSIADWIGQRVIASWSATVGLTELLGLTLLRGTAALAGHARIRAVDVLGLMRESGASALAIVTIVNGLVGGILAFLGAVQLRRFGAEIYVADLVGIAVVRELAAIMTAIVMAGRTGGAFAAQLATMQGNQEIDALQAFGIPVFDYLVLPRIAALVAMMPLLYIYACLVGLVGGGIVSALALDVSIATYIEETRRAIASQQFIIGLTKSVAFGALVALVACHIGLRAGRSAADVGRAATSAVVAGIIGVIALDAVFAVCTNALRI